MSRGWKDRYAKYIASGAWSVRRWDRLAHDRFKCQLCGDEANEVHHLTYERIFQENREDLVSLCPECHALLTECAKSTGAYPGEVWVLALEAWEFDKTHHWPGKTIGESLRAGIQIWVKDAGWLPERLRSPDRHASEEATP